MTPKRPPNTTPCKPIQLFPVLQRMMPFTAQRGDPKELHTFTAALAATIAKVPSNYFQSDNAQALDAGYLMRNEYALPWPLSAQMPDRNKFLFIVRQVMGDLIATDSINGWYDLVGRPISSLMPEESRKYNWDAELVASGLKLGILLENLLKIQSACVAVKRANAKPEELETLHEISLSADGQELARQEINAYAANIESAIARSTRAFDSSMTAEPTGKEIVHAWRDR